jgi:hypothetical protein
MRTDVGISCLVASPTTHKCQWRPTPKVDTMGGSGEEETMKVRRKACRGSPGTCVAGESLKLLIFNIHGTLLDCSLFRERNPNSAVRSTLNTGSRRVVFRPWLVEFLFRCFKNFKVAFLGSKSEGYMQEIAPAMLGRLKGGTGCSPCFVWSEQDYEVIEFEDGSPIAWGKPLEKVFCKWPCWNHSNTIIIDHKACRLACNPSTNVIIPPPFYVDEVQKVGDDQQFLKVSLWLILQRLYGCLDIANFRSHVPNSILESGFEVPRLHENKTGRGLEMNVEGEGTSKPYGSIIQLSPLGTTKYHSN